MGAPLGALFWGLPPLPPLPPLIEAVPKPKRPRRADPEEVVAGAYEPEELPDEIRPRREEMRRYIEGLAAEDAILCLPNEVPVHRRRKPPPSPDLVRRVIDESALPLADYQRRDLAVFDRAPHGIAACYATGMGKTMLAAACAARLAHEVPGLRVLYIATKSLQGNMEAALCKYIGREPAAPGHVHLNIIPAGNDRLPPRERAPLDISNGAINLTSCTYEGFYSAWVRDITVARGTFLVFDEAHHMRTDIYNGLRSNLADVANGVRGGGRARAAPRNEDADGEGEGEDEDDKADARSKITEVPPDCRQLFKRAVDALKEMLKRDHYDPVGLLWRAFGIYVPPHAPRSLACVYSSRLALATLCLTATPFYDNAADGANLVAAVRGEDLFGRTAFRHLMGVALRSEDASRIGYSEVVFRNTFRGLFVFQDADPAREVSIPRTLPLEVKHVPMTDAYQRLYLEVEAKAENSPYEEPWPFYNGVRRAANNVERDRAFGPGADVKRGTGLVLRPDAIVNPKCDVVLRLIRAELDRPIYATWDAGRTRPCGKVIVHSTFISCGIRVIQAHLQALRVPYVEITGRIASAAKRQQAISVFNASHTQHALSRVRVLFITDAGSEGIDPKGQTLVIKYEPSWNPSSRAQTFGRGSRRGALDHLRPEDRVVRLVQLLLVKQPRAPDAPRVPDAPSADHTLFEFTANKERAIDDVMARVRRAQV